MNEITDPETGKPCEYDLLDDLSADYKFANDPVAIERLWVDDVLPAPDGQVAIVLQTKNLKTGEERLEKTFVHDLDAEQP